MPYQKKMSDALYRVKQKFQMSGKPFFHMSSCSRFLAPFKSASLMFRSRHHLFQQKSLKQKIPRSKKDKAQFVFILEFFWVEVAFLESQDHYLQNLEKRSVVVQVAL